MSLFTLTCHYPLPPLIVAGYPDQMMVTPRMVAANPDTIAVMAVGILAPEFIVGGSGGLERHRGEKPQGTDADGNDLFHVAWLDAGKMNGIH